MNSRMSSVIKSRSRLNAPPARLNARHKTDPALALAEELEKRPVAAHCHLGLGKLYRRRGKREQAR